MHSVTRTFEYDNGEIQKVLAVNFEKSEALHFFKPRKSSGGFRKICDLYKYFAIPRAPFIFGRLMHFCLPEDVAVPREVLGIYEKYADKYGYVADEINKVTIAFREGLGIKKDGTVLEKGSGFGGALLDFYRQLEAKGAASVICGNRAYKKILPVSDCPGLLSESRQDAHLRANSTFFVMDSFDVASAYDTIGTPFGLMAEDGKVLAPPLFGREAFVVRRDGSISIERPQLKELTVCIGGLSLKDGVQGVRFFERPERSKTPSVPGKALNIAVIGERVAAVKRNGRMTIPASGFVVRIDASSELISDIYQDDAKLKALAGAGVSYSGMEDVAFAVSAGNSIIINGKKTLGFKSRFYDIRRFWKVKYPPTLYPLDFEKARAPRMAIGAKKDGSIVLLWAEGKGKFSYEPGTDSCGASLREMAEICGSFDIYNAVNLDGGGSAQIIFDGKRKLKISDRNKEDNSEAERAVPMGICV